MLSPDARCVQISANIEEDIESKARHVAGNVAKSELILFFVTFAFQLYVFFFSCTFFFSCMCWSCWKCRPSTLAGSGENQTWKQWAPSIPRSPLESASEYRLAIHLLLLIVCIQVRHRLNDDWAFGNDVDSRPWDFQANKILFINCFLHDLSFSSTHNWLQAEECALRSAVDRFNNRR